MQRNRPCPFCYMDEWQTYPSVVFIDPTGRYLTGISELQTKIVQMDYGCVFCGFMEEGELPNLSYPTMGAASGSGVL